MWGLKEKQTHVFSFRDSNFWPFPEAAIASNWEAQVSLGWDFEGEGWLSMQNIGNWIESSQFEMIFTIRLH